MKNQVFIDNLNSLIKEYANGNVSKFAKITGIKRPTIENWRKSGKLPAGENRYKLQESLNISIDRLLTGKNYVSIDEISHSVRLLGIHEPVEEYKSADYISVPLVSGRIAAGSGRIVPENVESWVWVYQPEIGQRTNLLAVKLDKNAESMAPTLCPGDIVIVDRDDIKTVSEKRIYAVRKGNDTCTVKRLHHDKDSSTWVLISDNPKYHPEVLHSDEQLPLIGRVIWFWRSLL